MINPVGVHKRIAKSPIKGHGFYLEYHKGQLVEFYHLRNRKRHGVYQRHFKTNPKRLREVKHYTDGVVDGRWRQWNEDGELTRDDTFELGFIPPLCDTRGEGRVVLLSMVPNLESLIPLLLR